MTQDLNFWSMAGVYAIGIIPLVYIWKFDKPLLKKALVSILRMTGQLFLIGLYLKYLFEWNSWILNVLWILVMLGIANWSALDAAGLNKKLLYRAGFLGTALSTLLVGLVFIFVLIRPEPLFDAMYLIPVFGMILGNCMRGNVMALERYFNDIHSKQNELFCYFTLGANFKEAVQPFYSQALKTALGPTLATMATMGIVSLPGMMTGQILGGASASVAIKYQLGIMICVFSTLVLGIAFNIYFSNKIAFNKWGHLRAEILVKPTEKK